MLQAEKSAPRATRPAQPKWWGHDFGPVRGINGSDLDHITGGAGTLMPRAMSFRCCCLPLVFSAASPGVEGTPGGAAGSPGEGRHTAGSIKGCGGHGAAKASRSVGQHRAPGVAEAGTCPAVEAVPSMEQHRTASQGSANNLNACRHGGQRKRVAGVWGHTALSRSFTGGGCGG